MNEQTRKDLNPYKATKQYFSKNRNSKKIYKECINCGDNDKGFCRHYNKWCNLCSYLCTPFDKPNVYHYKDTHGQWHHVRY